MRPERESRPEAGQTSQAAASSTAIKNGSIVAPCGDQNLVVEPPSRLFHPKAVAPAYVVFVLRRDRRGWRRQVFVSLAGANKAVERARVNGVEAQVHLMELVPTPAAPLLVVGGGLDD